MERKKLLKKRILRIAFILLNIGSIAWTAYHEYASGKESISAFHEPIHWVFIVCAVICLLLSIAFGSAVFYILLKKVSGRTSVKHALEVMVLGRYYDNITPSGIGGQPFQIYFLKKRGYGGNDSAVVTTAGFVARQLSFIIMALFVAIFKLGIIKTPAVLIAARIGIVLYSLLPLAILFFTFAPNVGAKILSALVRFLSKIKVIKNQEKAINAVDRHVIQYSTNLRVIINSPKLIIATLVLSFLYQAALCSIPYFLVHAFNGTIGYWSSLATIVTIYCAITILPTPGNAGAAEGLFYSVFSMLTAGNTFRAMLTWRLLIYYSYLVVGFLLQLHITKKDRSEK